MRCSRTKKEKKFKERKVTNILCPVLWCTNLSQKVNIMMPTDKIFNSFHAHKLQGKSFSCHVEICCCHFFSGTSIICHAIKSLKQTMYFFLCLEVFGDDDVTLLGILKIARFSSSKNEGHLIFAKISSLKWRNPQNNNWRRSPTKLFTHC